MKRATNSVVQPKITEHYAISICVVGCQDILSMAESAGLTICAPENTWDNIADQIAAALDAYEAGQRHTADTPSHKETQARGVAIASAARAMMTELGIDTGTEDPRAKTWHATQAMAEVLEREPKAMEALQPLFAQMEVALLAKTSAAPRNDKMSPQDVSELMQRAFFPMAPTLAAIANIGDVTDRHYGQLVTRGGRIKDRSLRILFDEFDEAFKRLFGRSPQSPGSGGRTRARKKPDLQWHVALFQLVGLQAERRHSPLGEHLRKLANDALDVGKAEPLRERLATWVHDAARRTSKRQSRL